MAGDSIAVKSIKKQHLVEVRSMANPPAIVKTTLESICLLLGEGTSTPADWKTIRSVIMRENFISTIVNLNTDDITYLPPLYLLLNQIPYFMLFTIICIYYYWSCLFCLKLVNLTYALDILLWFLKQIGFVMINTHLVLITSNLDVCLKFLLLL